jgi:putative colanic acid biosynthesis UDP-glucose lipid carrier transferase
MLRPLVYKELIKQPFYFFHRFHCKRLSEEHSYYPKDLNTAIRHTTTEPWLPDKVAGINQNGIVNPFVASRKRYLFLKRSFDILSSLVIIAGVMSWLVPLIGLFIKLDSRGPVFFRQKRIGRNGRTFYCIKFRTMYINDEADERPATKADERITRIGRALRHRNIDELPQFFNVLVGDMSVIGPRPHMITDCIRFSFVISSYSFRNLVRPGITGWAQVNGCHGPITDHESIIKRYNWDAMYVGKFNAWLDAKIIFKTLKMAIKKRRAMGYESRA